MKIDFSAHILDLKGEPIKENDKLITLGAVVANALLASYEDERNIAGTEKVKRFKLALLADECGEKDLPSEDVTLIKSVVAKGFSSLIVGRVYELLDPTTSTP